MGIIKKIALFAMFAAMGGAALAVFPAERAYAGTYDLSLGDIAINCTSGGQTVTQDSNSQSDDYPIITGTSTQNEVITINVSSGCTAKVKLCNVNITFDPEKDDPADPAAVSITGAGNVVIELDGVNTLQSGRDHAGIEKNNSGSLEICGTGSLTVTGGPSGAGIGGGYQGTCSKIKITGGDVIANGGTFGAGIGGGFPGDGYNIEITGGTVTANGGISGAGIGGGYRYDGVGGAGYNIKIMGGEVTANGGDQAAGIGGGRDGAGSNIEITEGKVTANGGFSGAGIGGGLRGAGSNIEITKGEVTAAGGISGAGIGGGESGAGSIIKITGGKVTAAGGISGAGIGGGLHKTGSDITISNDAKVMAAGGRSNSGFGAGAAIGGGGSWDDQRQPVDGNPVYPDITGIYTTGIIKYYAGGTGAAAMNDGTATPSKIITLPQIITFDPNGGSCNTTTATTVSSNSSQVLASLPVAIRENYKFDGWFTAKEGGDKITTDYDFKFNYTVYAHWIPIYTISFDPNGGTVSPGSGTTDTDGKLGELPTPERKGYSFTGWFTEKDGGTEVTISTVFTSDAAVYAHWEKDEPKPEPGPAPKPDTPKEDVITVSDNKPMAVSTESKGEFNITYAHEIPFYGKGKITPEYFGGLTVSQGNATYNVNKIKVNKKSKRIQITGLSGADKDTVKKIKKATKGSNGLPFICNPYYVRDTDKATPKFNKKGELKSVKILINNKDYKAKKEEFSYDSGTKQITFKGSNLSGSYQTR